MTVTAFLIHGASGQNLSYPAPAPATAEPADVNTWKVRLCQLAGGRLGTEQARLYGWLGCIVFENFDKDVHSSERLILKCGSDRHFHQEGPKRILLLILC